MSTREIFNYFYAILAKRDYTTGQLTEKGLKKGFSGSEVKQAVHELVNQKLVNDRRFAENLAERYKTQKGIIWIKQKMKQYKLSIDLIEEILEHTEVQPDDNLKQKVQLKYKITDWQNIDPKIKQKMFNYLGRQGFPNPGQILREWAETT